MICFDMKKNKRPFVLWFTWYSAAWKTTIAKSVLKKLKHETWFTLAHLDGDVFRKNFLTLGFTKQGRMMNLKLAAYVAHLLLKEDVCVLASFITPYHEIQKYLREKLPNYIEVFVNTSLEDCKKRDYKWNYKRAIKWEIQNFTGISDSYEPPISPEIILQSWELSVEESVEKIRNYLIHNDYI